MPDRPQSNAAVQQHEFHISGYRQAIEDAAKVAKGECERHGPPEFIYCSDTRYSMLCRYCSIAITILSLGNDRG